MNLRTKIQNNKEYVFDRLRKQYVRLTPEESVRQQFIDYLIREKNFPEGLLANEVTIAMGNVTRRCDTVLYDRLLQPQMIIEYKAPTITINQQTFNQIARYNTALNVPWLIICNGVQHYCCHIVNGEYSFVKELPAYEAL